MSEPILPLRQWPAGIQQASVPANDNALRLEALSRPVLGVADDEESGAVGGDVWIVGDTPTGAFASFDENDLALYHVNETTGVGGWHAWAPVEWLRVVVNDVRKVFDGAAWVDDPAGGGSGDVTGPSGAVAGNLALFADTTGKVIEDGGTPGGMAFIDDAASDGTGYVRKNGAWVAESGGGGGGMTNPMTTAGDIIYGGSSGTPTRLAASTDGYVLTLASGAPTWAASGGGGGSDVVDVITPTNSSGTVTLNFASKSKYVGAITLSANVTTLAFSNLPGSGKYAEYELHITQDGTGSRTFAIPASHKALGGSDTSIASAASAVTVLTASTVDNGTTWRYAMQESA